MKKKLFCNGSVNKTLILGDTKTNQVLIVERPCILMFCSSFYRVTRVTCMIAPSSRTFDGHCCMRNSLQWFSKTGKRSVDNLDTTLFRLPAALSLSAITSGRHSAFFLVPIKMPGICLNCSLVDEIMLFGTISKLISTISRYPCLFYSVYLSNLPLHYCWISERKHIKLISH